MMPLALTKEFLRLWSINSGIVMVVTDLHGDWEAYQRYRDCFVDLHSKGQADCLIFTGDLIHSDSEELTDRSLDIVLDVMALQASFGDAIIYLCGNHELPHIYGFGLAKGRKEYTSSFEKALSASHSRSVVANLFTTLPFYVRTAAGVSLTHAGATPLVGNPQAAFKLFTWDHKELLLKVNAQLENSDLASLRRSYTRLSRTKSYDTLARHYLAVDGVDDPRYDDLLRGFFATLDSDFGILRSALFTRCESEYGIDEYRAALEGFLQFLSLEYVTQKALVCGHMAVQNGYQVIAGKHLRLASGVHAMPQETGQYLLFDAAQSVENVGDLLLGLCSIYPIA